MKWVSWRPIWDSIRMRREQFSRAAPSARSLFQVTGTISTNRSRQFQSISPMPASLAQLKFSEGVPSLHCPATGRQVHSDEWGTDTESAHSPHLRFLLDWAGNAYVVPPDVLPPAQTAYQREIVRVLGAADGTYESDNARIAACCAAMPDSAIVFEVLDAPQGSFGGETAYYGFDLAPLPAGAGLDSVRLRAIPRGVAGGGDVTLVEPEPDPRVAPFGYFGTDRFGTGMFRWSGNVQESLARYVQEDLLGGLLEDEATIEKVTALHNGWKQSGAGLTDVLAQLNAVTGDDSTVVWFGTFDELAHGGGDFAREVRQAWRHSQGGCSSPVALGDNESAEGPVPDSALSEFIAFIATYGY